MSSTNSNFTLIDPPIRKIKLEHDTLQESVSNVSCERQESHGH